MVWGQPAKAAWVGEGTNAGMTGLGGGAGRPSYSTAGLVGGGLGIIGDIYSAEQMARAQEEANRANALLEAQRLNEERYRFDLMTGELGQSRREREDAINRMLQERFTQQAAGLDPFAETGRLAATEQAALLGLSGGESQQAALGRLTESPGQAFLRERQERALLRNAAALGGLGGGNIRRALQEEAFGRAQTDIERQIGRLGGVAARGQEAATAQIGGPGYLLTGQDIGVTERGVRPPTQPVQTGGGGGKGFLGGIIGGIGGLF